MSMLCKLDGIPVFYDIEDAKRWGSQYGLVSTHTHEHDGKLGFMAGNNHSHIISVVRGTIKTTNEETLLENWDEKITPQIVQQTQQTLDIEEDDEFGTPPPTILGGGY